MTSADWYSKPDKTVSDSFRDFHEMFASFQEKCTQQYFTKHICFSINCHFRHAWFSLFFLRNLSSFVVDVVFVAMDTTICGPKLRLTIFNVFVVVARCSVNRLLFKGAKTTRYESIANFFSVSKTIVSPCAAIWQLKPFTPSKVLIVIVKEKKKALTS